MSNEEREDGSRTRKDKESFFLGGSVCVFVFDTQVVTNQILPPMAMIWHLTAKFIQSLSQ